jgi:hypothetical protein
MNGGGGKAAKTEKKATGRSLSDLDKFDKKIKVRKVEKDAKPAVRAFNKMIKDRKK